MFTGNETGKYYDTSDCDASEDSDDGDDGDVAVRHDFMVGIVTLAALWAMN